MNPIDTHANARRFGHRDGLRLCGHRWPGGAGLALSCVLNFEDGARASDGRIVQRVVDLGLALASCSSRRRSVGRG